VTDANSGNGRRKEPKPRRSELTNIVKTAVRIIAGSDTREVSRAAQVIRVSERQAEVRSVLTWDTPAARTQSLPCCKIRP
jgi:hypothetical protein